MCQKEVRSADIQVDHCYQIYQAYQIRISCIILSEVVLFYCMVVCHLHPTLTGLQLMLDSCCAAAVELNLQFNAKKSHCIAFGELNRNVLRPMVLNNSTLTWVPVVKYLHLVSGRKLSFDINPAKGSCNSESHQAH